MSPPASQKFFAPLVLTLMAAGVAVILFVTRHGAGVSLDAVYYLSEARTWAATGRMVIPDFYGGVQPTTHWPPFYPFLLAIFGHFTGDAPSGARWLGAVVFALNIMLVAWLGRRAAQSPWGGLASAFVFACAPAVLLVHASIMSEAPCLAWWLLSVLLLLRYQDSESSGLLAASALAAGLAIFTRYGAVAVIPAAVFFLLVYGRSPVARRLGLALVYALIAAVPTAIYLILHLRSDPPLTRTIHWPAAEAQRHFHYFGITSQQMLASIRAFEEWLCPVDAWSFHFRLVFFVLFGAGLLFGLGQMFRAGKTSAADQPPRGRVSALFLANGVAYLAVILLTGMFFDPALDMSSRMYLPAFVFALLLAAACWPFLREAVLARPRGAMFGVAGALLLLLLGVYAVGAARWLRHADEDSLGLTGAAWRNSPAVAFIQQLPADAPVYSNNAKLIYYYTGRTDVLVPPAKTLEYARNAPNPDFAKEMAAMLDDVAQRRPLLVMLTADSPSLTRFVSPADLKKIPSLKVIAETPDALFFAPASRPLPYFVAPPAK